MKRMKEVSFLVDEDTKNKNISLKVIDKSGAERYLNSFTYRYVDIDDRPYEKYGLSDSEAGAIKRLAEDSMPLAPTSPPSRKEFDALCIRVQRLELLTTSFQPSAEEGLRIVGCSDKEIEEIRSRVEKLEQESERQCARVIKMEEGISDDLK